MADWKFESFIEEGKEFRVNGINIWNHTWHCSERKVEVRCPHEGQVYHFKQYEIKDGESEIHFLAGEFSDTRVGLFLKDVEGEKL